MAQDTGQPGFSDKSLFSTIPFTIFRFILFAFADFPPLLSICYIVSAFGHFVISKLFLHTALSLKRLSQVNSAYYYLRTDHEDGVSRRLRLEGRDKRTTQLSPPVLAVQTGK